MEELYLYSDTLKENCTYCLVNTALSHMALCWTAFLAFSVTVIHYTSSSVAQVQNDFNLQGQTVIPCQVFNHE